MQKRGKQLDNRNIPILVLSSLLECATELKHFSQQSRPFLGPQEVLNRYLHSMTCSRLRWFSDSICRELP